MRPSSSAASTALLLLASTVGALSLLSSMASAQEQQQQQQCSLQCQQDAPCVHGAANFSSQPNLSGTDTDFATTNNIDGMHCSCPHRYTGVLCEIPYESCGSQHPCYNNGECVPGLLDEYGNEQLYCNCGNAIVDGTQYVGKYCEHAADSNEYCDSAKTQFCVQGTCNPNYPNTGDPCICPTGYSGPNCQYKTGTVPNCDLPCQNKGVCSLDFGPDEPAYQYWEDASIDATNVTADGGLPASHMRCKCPTGYTGRYCETLQVACGESFCLNGGSCISHVVNGVTQYDCDCTSSYTDAASYAGSMCQYPATAYCTKSAGGLNGNLFCVNHGQCKENPVNGCDCPNPYTGFSCEFLLKANDNRTSVTGGSGSGNGGGNNNTDDVWLDDLLPPIAPMYGDVVYDNTDETNCDLKCQNGGTCRVGVKDVGVFADLKQNAPYVNDTSHDNFQHCVCPDGYYGVYCEEQVQVCGDSEHLCLNGGKCIRNDQDETACDCVNVDTSGAVPSAYAGNHCEHPVNDICTEDSIAAMESAPLSFCVNGGTCKKRVAANEPHPGCVCDPGFTGPHCELRASSITYSGGSATPPPKLPVFQIIVLLISTLAIFAVGMFAGSIVVRRRRKRKDFANSLRWADGLYRDEPGSGGLNQVNIAPRRGSYVDEPYSASEHSSATDPMATHLAPKTTTSAAVVVSDEDEEDEPEPQPTVYIGPPRDEDGHELHNVEIC